MKEDKYTWDDADHLQEVEEEDPDTGDADIEELEQKLLQMTRPSFTIRLPSAAPSTV